MIFPNAAPVCKTATLVEPHALPERLSFPDFGRRNTVLTGVGEKTVVCVRRPAKGSRQADLQPEMTPTLIRNMQEKPPDRAIVERAFDVTSELDWVMLSLRLSPMTPPPIEGPAPCPERKSMAHSNTNAPPL